MGRHDRTQLRPVAPGLADDRPGALHPGVRAAHPPRPGQGRRDRPRRALRARRHSRPASAGRSRACRALAKPTGARSSPPCGPPGTTATSSSSTRTVTSRAPTSSSSAASCWPATSSGPTSSEPRERADQRRDRHRAPARQDDRPLASQAGARRRLHRGRLPPRGGVRRRVGVRAPGGREACRLDPRRHGRGGRHGGRLPARLIDHRHQGLRGRATRSPMGPPSSTWSSTIGALALRPRPGRAGRHCGRRGASPHEAGAIVKVILENAYLTDDQKERGSRLAEAAGGDFVKTSTGYAPSGATHEDLALMRRVTSAARADQGGRRRSDPRRPAGRDEPRRDPRRRHRRRSRSSTTSEHGVTAPRRWPPLRPTTVATE